VRTAASARSAVRARGGGGEEAASEHPGDEEAGALDAALSDTLLSDAPTPPDATCYFKSTDGHPGTWLFSLTRLNLAFAESAARAGGALIVDATRSGKRFPDALARTLPLWAAVLNAIVFGEEDGDEGGGGKGAAAEASGGDGAGGGGGARRPPRRRRLPSMASLLPHWIPASEADQMAAVVARAVAMTPPPTKAAIRATLSGVLPAPFRTTFLCQPPSVHPSLAARAAAAARARGGGSSSDGSSEEEAESDDEDEDAWDSMLPIFDDEDESSDEEGEEERDGPAPDGAAPAPNAASHGSPSAPPHRPPRAVHILAISASRRVTELGDWASAQGGWR
jgi:hypothetical protein